MENLPEYKLIADDDGRRAAFAKFIKRQKVGRSLRKYAPLIKDTFRNVYERQHLKMEVLQPVASARTLHKSTKRIKNGSVIVTATATVIGNVTANGNGNGNAIRTVIEAKTTTKSREAQSIITAVVTMPNTREGTDIVLLIGTTKSERKIILRRGRRRIGNTVGRQSTMREMMGENAKERKTGSGRGGSGMMYQEGRVETEVFQSEGRIGFMMRGRRRCYNLFSLLNATLTDC
jgi:hypothetical protein